MIDETITEDTPFVPEDDTYHPPTVDDPLWFETTWWSFSVPERRHRRLAARRSPAPTRAR